jgi:hypothetical protein
MDHEIDVSMETVDQMSRNIGPGIACRRLRTPSYNKRHIS